MKEEIVLRFDMQGIVLSIEEIESIAPPKDIQGVKRMIKAAYTNRKLTQFFQYPIIDDLEEDNEILPVVLHAVKTEGNPIRKTLQRVYPELTIGEIAKSIEDIEIRSKSITRNKCAMVLFYGLVLFIITHIIHKLIARAID